MRAQAGQQTSLRSGAGSWLGEVSEGTHRSAVLVAWIGGRPQPSLKAGIRRPWAAGAAPPPPGAVRRSGAWLEHLAPWRIGRDVLWLLGRPHPGRPVRGSGRSGGRAASHLADARPAPPATSFLISSALPSACWCWSFQGRRFQAGFGPLYCQVLDSLNVGSLRGLEPPRNISHRLVLRHAGFYGVRWFRGVRWSHGLLTRALSRMVPDRQRWSHAGWSGCTPPLVSHCRSRAAALFQGGALAPLHECA